MQVSFTRSALSVAVLSVLLAACGGGDSSRADAQAAAARDFAARIQAATASPDSAAPVRRFALAAAGEPKRALASVGAKELFDWAEYIYPTLFPKGPQNLPFNYLGTNYTIRVYPNGNYLGLTDTGLIYGLGPFTGNVLTPFGKLSDYVARVQADECKVYPGNCVPTPNPTGSLNECTLPAAQALAIGNRLVITYETTGGGSTSTTASDSLVDQNTTFEGQNVVRVSSTLTTSSTISGISINNTTKSKSYLQAADGGLSRLLGNESEITTGGIIFMGQTIGATVTNTRIVYNPGSLNSEFTLTAGQSLNKAVTSTVTTTSSLNPAPQVTTGTTTDVYTYEKRESVTVRGKTYDTCRYRSVPATGGSATTSWFIVGKGVPVRSESVQDNVPVVTEMVSGTMNGAPL